MWFLDKFRAEHSWEDWIGYQVDWARSQHFSKSDVRNRAIQQNKTLFRAAANYTQPHSGFCSPGATTFQLLLQIRVFNKTKGSVPLDIRQKMLWGPNASSCISNRFFFSSPRVMPPRRYQLQWDGHAGSRRSRLVNFLDNAYQMTSTTLSFTLPPGISSACIRPSGRQHEEAKRTL